MEEYGPGFYKHIGRKGGEAVKEKYGEDYFSTIGKKGGEAVLQKYGTNFYSEIAQQGDDVSDARVDEQKSMHQLYEELKGIVEQFNELVNTSK